VLGIAADQRHQGFIAEHQDGQGTHAVNTEQGLQPVAQDIKTYCTYGTIAR
jgi:hypothetical protein